MSLDGHLPADLRAPPFAQVLGKMPDKTYTFTRDSGNTQTPLALPAGATVMEALHRVLRLPSVCSKRFLTTKVDRHVTGESVGETPSPHAY